MSRCTLPTTPGALLGYRKNGRPILLIAGGDGTTDQGQQQSGAGDGAQNAQGGQQQAGTGDQSGQQANTGQQANGDQQQRNSSQSVDDLPDWAQKIVRDARKDAGDARVAGKTAAEQAQKELTEKLAVALGLKPDAATDPAELAKQVTAAQTEARTNAVHLAVFQHATHHQADPAALLDSNSFMRTVAELDHKTADFATKVDAAIKDAVKNNPKLKAVQAAGRSGAQFTGGSGEGNNQQRPTSLHAALAAQRQR